MLFSEKEKVNFNDYDIYQSKFTRKDLEVRIQKFLKKDDQIGNYYKLTDNALYVGDLKSDKIDYILYLSGKNKISSSKSKFKQKSLKGLRIAIDPGHFGGELAELEKRFIHVPVEKTKNKPPIIIHEGFLTYLTAIELKSYLEAEGAVVFVTRPRIGKGAIESGFYEWLKEKPELLEKSKDLSELFRKFYNKEDLVLRSKKINSFNPDLTIIIHYNVHLTQEEKNNKEIITKTNYNLAFVPGAFCANELNREKDRYEFLRLLLTNDMDESLRLSQCLVNQFTNRLQVPLIDDKEKTSYLDSVCMKQCSGVYARNLALTRLIRGPLCYGETLIQNNEHEYLLLSKKDAEIESTPCPSRVKEVAKAYFEGIKSYLHCF